MAEKNAVFSFEFRVNIRRNLEFSFWKAVAVVLDKGNFCCCLERGWQKESNREAAYPDIRFSYFG